MATRFIVLKLGNAKIPDFRDKPISGYRGKPIFFYIKSTF
jgi:hypothetical protein